MDKIALISDVHGNMPALEVVLADIRARGIDVIYNLGDVVGKGPSSAEAFDRCREVCQVIVRGNWDDGVARDQDSPIARWYRDQLGPERSAALLALPNSFDFRLSGQRVRLVHASPQGEHHRVHPGSGQAALEAMFDNTDFTGHDNPPPDIVAYGDIHGVYLLGIDIGEGCRTLFNVGSVGNPLDLPLASYAIMTGVLDGEMTAPWSIEFARLAYDIEATLAEAQRVGLPDVEAYSVELRTAVYRRRQPKV
jgi:predicted phosphodiesterase